MSPWTLMKPLKRPRKEKEQKEIFFDLISGTSGTCTNDEKINLLATKSLGWKVSQWKQQLFPEHIDYNIGDCDLIMGPVLADQHWFCISIDPSTKNFYVLDSMKTNIVMSKNESNTKRKHHL
ncbi:hypothetical protein K1719_002815 [Acacia pycnantha]|nr:hypothetical protein K1719_002815 [Acacia pycnantha]